MKICNVYECERKAELKGVCKMHYARFQRHGSYESLTSAPPCKLCGGKHYARGYCYKHYLIRGWDGKKPYYQSRSSGTYMKAGKCEVHKCERGVYCKTYCKRHYTQILRTGKILKQHICPKCGTDTQHEGVFCFKHTRAVRKYDKIYGATLTEMGRLLKLSRQRIHQLHVAGELKARLENEHIRLNKKV